MKSFSKKLAKKPLALSPLSLAIAACGGGGGDSSSSNQSSNSNSSTSTSYGSYLYSITSREMESNNTPKTANFAKQTVFTGQTYSNDDDDYYYVNVPDWDVIVLNFSSSDTSPHVVSIIDSLGFTLSSNDLYTNATIVAKPYHAGEVYVLVEGTRFDTKDYTISLSQGSGNYEMEPNNLPNDADQIYNNTPIKGQSHSSDDDDYFTFTATSSTTIISFSTSDTSAHSISILNSAEQTMSMADIYTSGTLTASTFIGQKYYVLVDGTRFDKSEYTLTLNPGSASNDPNNTIGTTGVANFSEQDSPETPNDYDWAALDTANSKFALHIEDYEFFDRAYNDILDGSVRTQFAIGYGNTNSEDPNYISQSQSDFNWIDADSIQISGSGLTKQIIVTDQTIKNTVIDTGYDYIQFAIMTDEVWVMDDFAVADVSIA